MAPTTLTIDTAHVRRVHPQRASRSNPRQGIAVHLNRSSLMPRVWTAAYPNETRAKYLTLRDIYIAGGRGVAEYTWTPPSGGAVPVLVSKFKASARGASSYSIDLEITELLGSDT